MSAGELEQHYVMRPSRLLGIFLLLSSSLLLMVICTLPLTGGWQPAGVAGVLVATGFVLWRDALLRDSRSGVAFQFAAGGSISFRLRKGEWLAGTADRSSFVSPCMVLLNITTDAGKKRSLVIMPDSMDKDDFRRLRVRLRWSAQGHI